LKNLFTNLIHRGPLKTTNLGGRGLGRLVLQ